MKLKNCILGSSLTALGFSGSVLAQGIQEIIVTAQKREESAQEIPLAIDVITGDTFIQEGIRDVKDIGKTSTELEINSNNGQATRIGIRGLQQNGFAPTGDTMAAAHLDGIFLGSFWSLNGLMFDLERVEVLSGPQGTLYGRNSAADAVNLISRRPGDEFSADGNVEFGNLGTQRFNGGVSVPLGDSFAFRLAGTKFKRDALYSDGGGAVNQSAGRLSALWRPTDSDTLYFTYDYIDTGGTNETGGLLRTEPVDNYTTTWNGTTSVGSFNASTPASVNNVASLVGNDPYDNAAYIAARGLVFGGDLYSKHWGAMLNYAHDFGSFEFVAQYSHRDLEAVANVATRAATAPFNQIYPMVADSDVAELRLVSDDQGSVTWVGGLFFYQTSIVHGNAVPNAFNLPPITVTGGRQVPVAGFPVDPNTGLDIPGCPCLSGFSPVNGDTEAYAAYGQLTWTPDSLPDWHFTAGLRYSYDKKSTVQGYFVNSVLYSLWVPGTIPAFLQPSVILPSEATATIPATVVRTDGEDNWGSFQYRFGVEYDVSDTSLLYASIATGYKSGGFAYGSTPRLEPETLLAFEVGSKSRFVDNTVQFNTSAWFYDYRDIEFGITRALNPPFPIVNNNPQTTIGSVGNVGKVYLGGLAFDLEWAPTSNDRVNLSGTHIWSEVKDGYETLDGVRRQVLHEGERFGDSPKWQWIGRYSHTFEFTGGSSLTPMVKYQYQTSKYDGANIPAGSVAEGATTIDPQRGTYNLERKNPGQTKIPAQGIMDLQARWEAASGTWDVTAYVHNVFDDLDIKTINYTNNPGVAAATAAAPVRTVGANSSYGHVTATLGEPRTYGVILGVRF